MGQEEFATWEEVPIGYADPSYAGVLTREQVAKYVDAVEETNPLYCDEEIATASEWGGIIAPCTAAQLYGGARAKGSRPGEGGRKAPPGGVHAKQYYEFHHPARVGDTLTCKTTVADKYIKRERKYIVQETVTTNQDGQVICVERRTLIRSA